VADEQPAVLAVGADLPRPDDDGGGDRPAGAPQCDPRTEPAELPAGAGEEDQGGRSGVSQTAGGETARVGPAAGEPRPPQGKLIAAQAEEQMSPITPLPSASA